MKTTKNIFFRIILSILCLCTFLSASSVISFADEKNYPFDKKNVLIDLESVENFNILDYPYDSSGLVKRPSIINVVEWCYSFDTKKQSDFALYLYIYNPQNLLFDIQSSLNNIEMAVKYDTEIITNESVATDYEKFSLVYCNNSFGDYDNLFYKFRVLDHKSADNKTILERVNSLERRYDISSIELLTIGSTSAVDYNVGGTYKFTGYAKGYGNTEENSLKSTVIDLETIELKVHHTNYRTGISELGTDHYNNLDTVYFSIPDNILAKYGALQKIKAEWYEYKTSPILVVNTEAYYNTYSKCVGTTSFDLGDNYLLAGASVGSNVIAKWGLNAPSGFEVHNKANSIQYLFYKLNNGDVSSNEIMKWIKDYSSTRVKDINNKYNSALFNGSFTNDPERTRGYNCKEFDAGETLNLLDYDSSHSGWQKFWEKFGKWNINSSGGGKYSPIVKLTDSIMAESDDETLSKTLFVKAEDLNSSGTIGSDDYDVGLRNYVIAEKAGAITSEHGVPSTTHLFRFADTDYYTTELGTNYKNLGISSSHKEVGYYAEETVFLDFDVLQLTFNKNGNYLVMPVVNSPIDIINGITAPPSNAFNLTKLLMLLALIFLIILLLPLLPSILKGVIFIITAPFKLIGWLITNIKPPKKNNHRK